MTQNSDGPRRSAPPNDQDDLERRRARLDQELQRRTAGASAGEARTRGTRSDVSGMALALRLGSEFVAAVLVGALLGGGLDVLAGSGPWGLIVFLLLGFAAGVLNVMRSAGLVRKPGE